MITLLTKSYQSTDGFISIKLLRGLTTLDRTRQHDRCSTAAGSSAKAETASLPITTERASGKRLWHRADANANTAAKATRIRFSVHTASLHEIRYLTFSKRPRSDCPQKRQRDAPAMAHPVVFSQPKRSLTSPSIIALNLGG